MQRRTGRSRATRATPAPDQVASPAITLPVVLVPEAVVLPHISAPLLLVDERAEAAVSRAFERDRRILILVEQREPEPPTEWIDRLVMGDDPLEEGAGERSGNASSPRASVGIIAELLHPIRRY